ncbi:calvin cycle protein CP12-3, chloroplastic-like [Mangifera indica]|uniref:calvin cycle protein CP12-3, chloroplastic-like n=1 Tax=Mangifera indica TaxID=29780 RepID=UPI001CFAF33A|nr:calvin cycle protein CP12-3, chloroplastic-like [Mangifera indica]
MASLASTGTTRTSFLASRSSCFCSKKVIVTVSVQQKKAERRNMSVKATGMAKFKGTHMREKHLTEMIEQKVIEAKQVCEGDMTSDECKVAWDEVEEVSQAKADLRRKLEEQDPLEFFCQDNPETDECRVYED